MPLPAHLDQSQPTSDSAVVATDVVTVEPPSQDAILKARSHFSAITTAAVIITLGNVAIFVSLPWTQSTLFGETNPAIWLSLGLLMPALLLSASVYKAYWERRDRQARAIERLGPYVLMEKLGSGGMGEVFLAEHQLMKRRCAVKLIHPNQARNREMRNCFEREAKATAQLTHWNTIEVYDYGTSDDGRFYYVMEYLQGVNLWEYVERYGPMPPGRVVYLMKQLCDALYEASCAGLVHRDIKPSNVFLTERGRSFDVAKLLDFGLVQAISAEPIKIKNVSKKLMGSPSFMCPEQAVGLTPDCRGDLYSLGAVAYFLLTGRPPFVDENPIMLIVAHATASVPTFEQIGVDVPVDLSAVILRCLARDPSARFDTARDLLKALEQCESSQEWTWQSAEQWWTEHEPGRSCKAAETTSVNEDTVFMTQPTDDEDPQATPDIDYEEATAIYDAVEELALT